MKGIEKITARIESDGKAETVQMLKEAEEKAAALLAGYKAKAEEETAAAVEAGKEAAVHQAERLESAAHMEAKKQYLAAKQACLANCHRNVTSASFLKNFTQESICQGGFHPKDKIPPKN